MTGQFHSGQGVGPTICKTISMCDGLEEIISGDVDDQMYLLFFTDYVIYMIHF